MSAWPLLAQHDPTQFSDWRVFAGIAFAVMWVVGQAIAVAKKKREDRELAQRRAERERMAGGPTAARPAGAIPPPARPPMTPTPARNVPPRPREATSPRPAAKTNVPPARRQQNAPPRAGSTAPAPRPVTRKEVPDASPRSARPAPSPVARIEGRTAEASGSDVLGSIDIELLPETPDAPEVTRRGRLALPPSRIVAAARNPESVRQGIIMAEVLGLPLALRDPLI